MAYEAMARNCSEKNLNSGKIAATLTRAGQIIQRKSIDQREQTQTIEETISNHFAQRPIVKTGNNHGTTPPYGRELPPGRTQKWKHIRISFPCCSVLLTSKIFEA